MAEIHWRLTSRDDSPHELRPHQQHSILAFTLSTRSVRVSEVPGSVPDRRAPIHHRKDIARLTRPQIAAFRRALSQTQDLDDDRGFQYWAGIHGLPLPMYCQHGSNLFLPWHRAYLYFLELALQDRGPTVSLPWWDWTSSLSHSNGIPEPYVETTSSGSGNPLAAGPINRLARTQFSAGGGRAPSRTSRRPGRGDDLPSMADVRRALELSDFLDFSTQLENIHNGVHVWVGGTMSEIPLAAYDPIFFAHHTMIDRIWRLWQLKHPGSEPPQPLLSEALPPFKMTVAQTLSVTSLGYDYAASTQHVPVKGS